MGKIIKSELNRGFCNRGMKVSLILSTLLVFWHAITVIPPFFRINALIEGGEISNELIFTSFNAWIGNRVTYLPQSVFYFSIPFLAVIPYGTSYYMDKESGYEKNIYIRSSKKHYLLAKYFSVFLCGGVAIVTPMILDFLLVSSFLPSVLPDPSYLYANVFADDKLASLFYRVPFVYMGCYLLLIFFISGLLATTALAITDISSKIYLPLFFPFFIYIISSLIFELSDNNDFSIRKVLETDAAGSTVSISIILAALLLLSFLPFYFGGRKRDIL